MGNRAVGGGWKASLAAVLKAHNGVKAGGSVASAATQDKRADVLYAGFNELRALGFKLDTVESFRGKHMDALVAQWASLELSASTLQNKLSIFRTFADWIGKAGMVMGADHYFPNHEAARSGINTVDKSWQSNHVVPAEKIAEVAQMDARVALQLELQDAFGLRARESMQLRPHAADHGTFLAINVGTKGGRDRVVAITTLAQRELLDRAKTFAATQLASTSDPTLRLAQVKNHYYHVVRSCGITRKDGITSHGLRHGYANQRYKDETGHASPVQGGGPVDRELDQLARLKISEDLGHSREPITANYLGR